MNQITSKISIIIPIYNVEAYLEKCINTVVQQTYSNLEIILVDDGSTDRSSLICDLYAKKDSRIYVIHKENGGLSDARNVGIKKATGAYIFYLDADDFIDKSCMEIMLKNALKYNADIVQAGFYYHFSLYNMFDTRIEEIQIKGIEQAMEALLKQDIIKNFAWGKLYKKEVVNLILFKKGVFFEDSFWQYSVINSIKKYIILPDNLYYYNQREGSISAQFTIKNIDLLKGTFERLNFIKETYPQLYPLAIDEFEKLYFQYLIMAKKTYKKEYKAIFNLIREITVAENYIFKRKLQYYMFFNLTLSIPIVDFIQRAFDKLFLNKDYYKKIEIEND